MICRFFIILNFLLSTKFLIAQANSKSGVFLNAGTGGYEEIVVIVGDELPRSSCPHILDSIKRSLTAASRSIYTATEGRAYLDKIAIEVPFSWAEVDCRTPLSTACLPPSNPRTGDFIIGEDHPIHGTFPFTQQYQGCGKPGEYVYLPYSFISSQNTSSQQGQRQSTAGQLIANQWARLRYGVFADLQDFTSGSSTINVASQQHAHCRAKSVHDVIYSHADFMQGGGGGHLLQAVNFTVPRFSLLRQAAPKYMIVLENSQTMNMEDNWSRIRTATKKFIVHDLPDVARVGLVLFNEAAHEGYPVSELRVESREGMAYSIGNKYDLSPSRSSCVRCGIEQAVQGLQESGVGAQGAVLIIISQGSISSFSLGDEKDMLDVAKRHSLQIYSISLPQLPVVDVNLSLERLAHSTVEERLFLEKMNDDTGGGKESRMNKIILDYIRVSNKTFPEYEDYEDEVVSVLMITLPIFSCLGQNNKQLVDTIREDEIESWEGSEYDLSMPPSQFLSQPSSFHDLQAVEVDTLIFKGKKKGGFFIEAGAFDFEYESTSLYFELLHNWTGLLVEPSQIYYKVGKAKNRKVKSINCCLSPKQRPTTIKLIDDSIVVASDGVQMELDVQCYPLYSILLSLDNPTVNYFSLDIEGGEYQVLETIPWDKVDIEVMSIETHFMGLRSVETKEDLILYLDKQGYKHLPGAHKSSGQTFEYESEDGKIALHDIENDLFVRKDIIKKYNVIT